MADLAALDLPDQAAARGSRCSLALEAALRGLCAVAAAVDEPPPHALLRLIRVDATAAPERHSAERRAPGETSALAASYAFALSSVPKRLER